MKTLNNIIKSHTLTSVVILNCEKQNSLLEDGYTLEVQLNDVRDWHCCLKIDVKELLNDYVKIKHKYDNLNLIFQQVNKYRKNYKTEKERLEKILYE